MPKNGFPMSTAKNGFHILNLHPKIYVFQKSPLLNANLLEKFPQLYCFCRNELSYRVNASICKKYVAFDVNLNKLKR